MEDQTNNETAQSANSDKSILGGITSSIKKIADATAGGIQFVLDKTNEHKHHVAPVLHGAVGHKLHEINPNSSIKMSLREDGKDISIRDIHFHEKLKKSNHTVVLFIHGLMSDEILWKCPFRQEVGIGNHLEKDFPAVILYLRYNTGLHISQNGRTLSNLLQEIINAGNGLVENLIIVSHSMGGLVTRSACYYAEEQNRRTHTHHMETKNQTWIDKLTKIFLIGVPHDGSFLEKIGYITTSVLKNIGLLSTNIVAEIADNRSDGIKDLRHGFMVDEDWQRKDNDALHDVKKTEVHPLPHVQYYVIAGALHGDASSPLSIYFGDGLVGKNSASGKVFYSEKNSASENIEFKIFTKVNHISLLYNQEVYHYILENILSKTNPK